jgi:ribonucleotide monophosphatase NagD (HAD superfamily)
MDSGNAVCKNEWDSVGIQLATSLSACDGHAGKRVRTCLILSVQVVVGKGGRWLVPFLLDSLALDPETTAVVGDRLDTDVAMGKTAGLCTVVPLTGVCTLREAMTSGDSSPDYVVDSLADLAAGLQGSFAGML